MSVKDLYPISGDHAIQSAVFALEWAGQLTPVDLDKVRALAPKFQRHGSTPRILDQKSLLINFSDLATGGGVSTKQQDFGGLRFEWIGKLSTVSRTLTVNESGCVVNVGDYNRWEKVWTDVQTYLIEISKLALQYGGIVSVGLQFVDLFKWKGVASEFSPGTVFRADTKFLPSNIFSRDDIWHSHHGYFDQSPVISIARRLNNINVSVGDDDGEDRFVQILCSHKATLSEPWTEVGQLNELSFVMNDLHDNNKTILRGLLTDEVLQLISLK